ncbi:MAG: hypothetical protein ACRCX2_18125, partial [Paraclostridium sp.]
DLSKDKADFSLNSEILDKEVVSDTTLITVNLSTEETVQVSDYIYDNNVLMDKISIFDKGPELVLIDK